MPSIFKTHFIYFAISGWWWLHNCIWRPVHRDGISNLCKASAYLSREKRHQVFWEHLTHTSLNQSTLWMCWCALSMRLKSGSFYCKCWLCNITQKQSIPPKLVISSHQKMSSKLPPNAPLHLSGEGIELPAYYSGTDNVSYDMYTRLHTAPCLQNLNVPTLHPSSPWCIWRW